MRNRIWMTVLGVVVTLLHLVFIRNGRGATVSQDLFRLLLLASGGSAIWQTCRFSIDLVSRERRQQTLGLLVLTGLSSHEIFLSKLTGALAIQLSNGMALLPCFAVSFVLGGVPRDAFLAAVVMIPSLTMVTLAITLAASTLARDEEAAVVIAAVLAGVVILGGPGIYCGLTLAWAGPPSTAWLLFSPPYGFFLIWDLFKRAPSNSFWWNSALSCCWAAGLLTGAAWLLRRTWRHEERAGGRSVWTTFDRSDWAQSITRRRASETRWLLPNPFVWLALRDKKSVAVAWAFVIAAALVWGVARWVWPRVWGTVASAIVGVLGMYSLVGLMAMYSAAKRIGEDRRSGALELLLTTPLSIEEILEGQRDALRIGFRGLRRSLPALSLVMVASVLMARSWDTLALTVFVECCVTVACILRLSRNSFTFSQVMWAALNSGRPLFTLHKVIFPPGTIFMYIYFGYTLATSSWTQRFPEGSTGEFWVVTLILAGSAVLAAFSRYSYDVFAKRLKKEFRWVTQQPVPDPSDARFRRWDAREPFPQGSSLRWLGQ